MPSLGSGLSLGTLNTIPGYDFDASTYITTNSILNSELIYNLNSTNSVRFIGSSSQFLSASHNSSLNITGNWSINFWLNADPVSLGASSNSIIFSKGSYQNSGFYIQVQSTTLRFNTNTSGVNNTLGSSFFYLKAPPNSDFRSKWVMCTITYNYSTTETKMYRNGVLMGTGNMPNPASSTDTFYIGRDANGNYLTAKLDETGIWTKILSQSEITELYNSGYGFIYSDLSSGLKTDLQHYWSFDESSSGTRYPQVGGIELSATNSPSNAVPLAGKAEYINPQRHINDFIKGLKNLNLWSNSLCWPLRDVYNRKTGTSVSNFGPIGTYPASLINGPVRTSRGINTFATDKYIGNISNFGLNLGAGTYSIFSVFQREGQNSDDGTQGYNYIWSRVASAYSPSYRIGPSSTPHLVFYADTNGASSLAVSPTNQDFDYTSLTISKNGQSTINTAFNRGTFTSYNISSLSFFGSTHAVDFGNNSSYVMTGFRALEYIKLSSNITQAESQSLYDLAKETIAYGIGLP